MPVMQVEPLRALFCNDGAASRRAVEVMLHRCGFDVVGDVASAIEAVVAASVGEPDAVVLDLGLTGDLGLGALAALHAASPGCAVILVSSFDTMRAAALEAGAYDFVGNADLRVLERSLRRLAAERRRVRQGDGDAIVAAPGQVEVAATSALTAAVIGSRSTNPPAS